jgi:hypothetical protein
MNNPSTTQPESSAAPRFCKSAELLGQEVEIVYVDEVDGGVGPEFLFDVRLPDGEVVSFSRHRDDWRRPGVEAMRELLDSGQPCMATLIQPGKAILWAPFDQRGSRVSTGRAARLRQLGFSVAADAGARPELRVDDSPPYVDSDAPLFDE